MAIALAGLANHQVTMIVTNNTAADMALPTTGIAASHSAAGTVPQRSVRTPSNDKVAAIEHFNRLGFAEVLSTDKGPMRSMSGPQSIDLAPAALAAVIGDTRSFNDSDGVARTTTLKRQVTLSDGVVARFWLENSETSKVTSAILTRIEASFAGSGKIYDMLKDTGGPVWGAHSYNNLIAGTGYAVDIVMLNFNKDNRPFGVIGFFYAANSFKKTSMPSSNEAISIYLDTETMYLAGENGLLVSTMTLAHEGMHMSNFYRRGVKLGPTASYDTWLEEMTAMMMEDAASNKVNPAYNPIRDDRFPSYLENSYRCPLMVFTTSSSASGCDSYSVSGSFGGFLLRQMGMGFFKNLLNQPAVDSEVALDTAIKSTRAASSLKSEFVNFSVASISTPDGALAPAGFNFPSRAEGDYVIPAINPKLYRPYQVLPLTAPSTLAAYSSFPVVQRAVSGTFTKTVKVPAGATLSVVVSN